MMRFRLSPSATSATSATSSARLHPPLFQPPCQPGHNRTHGTLIPEDAHPVRLEKREPEGRGVHTPNFLGAKRRGEKAALAWHEIIEKRDRLVSKPTERPWDPFLSELSSPTGDLDVGRLRTYARQYAEDQRTFNSRPNERLNDHPLYRHNLYGDVEYWDVDRNDPDVKLMGFADLSPFRTPDGKVRIFSHYLDFRGREALRDAHGDPSGSVPAEMTASYRTLVLFPETEAPFMLKFSGEWHAPKKRLEPKQARISVERSHHLRRATFLTPEPAALTTGRLTVIYRPIPRPRRKALAPNDALIPLSALNSKEFAESPRGRRLFARHGSQEAWLTRELAPQLARILWKSLRSSFAHLELHSQNIDLLVGASGKLKQTFIKDQLDIMHDPGAQLASGMPVQNVAALRADEWGNMGEANARFDTSTFYRHFLGQTTSRPPTLDRAVTEALKAIAYKRRDVAALARRPEYAALRDAEGSLPAYLEALRQILIHDDIDRNFEANPGAKKELVRSPGKMTSGDPRCARLADLESEDLLFGYVHKTPIAILRDAEGFTRRYYMRFE
ncbi:MAG: hypothetical protein IPK13_10965 [Deltaproteobacteria bacterium]|nr:hypothetical protein [Deltaproteobacteria bacterium]